MPMHDWKRVEAGTYHHFHQRWIQSLCDVFNTGGLPAGYFALSERVTSGPVPDVLALQTRTPLAGCAGGLATVKEPPKAHFVSRADEATKFARRADRIALRAPEGHLVAVIEIASPGNKSSKDALCAIRDKAVNLIENGIHFLLVDPFPPTVRDPQGLHAAVWGHFSDEPFELPPNKRLTLASYSAGELPIAYVEPVAVGDALPDMPLFLTANEHVPCPLEATYQTTWGVFPSPLKGLLEAAP